MFIKRKGVKSEARKSKSLLLRLFRPNDVFSGSLVSLESPDREDAHSENPKTIRNAVLEAEYQSAKALLAFQKNERFH